MAPDGSLPGSRRCSRRSFSSREGSSDAVSKPAARSGSRSVEHGKHLVTVLTCNDCHTPLKMGPKGLPEPDVTRMPSGHPETLRMPPPPPASGPWFWSGAATNTAFAGPWGVTYAINLTPEKSTGLDIWTEEMFVKTMRTGKHFGTSRAIQPPMPWQAYSHLSEEDLKAVFAYLRTIPPIANHVPDYREPPAPPKPAARK